MHAQTQDENSKSLSHKVRILEHSQEQIESGSSRDCERVEFGMGPVACMYGVGGGALVGTTCKVCAW